MKQREVLTALGEVKEARRKWGTAHREFHLSVDLVMRRLLLEATAVYLSAADVAHASGMTLKQVRAQMRKHGLNPTSGKRLLSQQAANALRGNAELLGVDPSEIDLMSPLAYLPAGKALRDYVQDVGVRGVTELEPELFESNEDLLNAGGVKCNTCRLNNTWVEDHCVNRYCPSNYEADRVLSHLCYENSKGQIETVPPQVVAALVSGNRA